MTTTMYVPEYAYDEDLPDDEQSEMIDEIAAHELYDDYLDEVCEEVKIGQLTYLPSRVLKEIDPIAYDCGFNDYTDANYVEIEV